MAFSPSAWAKARIWRGLTTASGSAAAASAGRHDRLEAAGHRRRGVSTALARAAVDFAKARGARALEGYPMITEPGEEITWGEMNVGSRSIFAAAGFTEVSRPTPRRVVMRIDF